MSRRARSGAHPPRVGLFGLLGSGNIGNDGSMEAVLAFLRECHPDAALELLCAGPHQVTARYGLPATRLHWYRSEYRTASSATAVAGKLLGKVVDAARTFNWVRRRDVVIVPGMGVLEATLPVRPWGFPYSLFLLCLCSRLAGTKTVLLSVGAEPHDEWAIRCLVRWSARLASYRSYRDGQSRAAVRGMGVDTTGDAVYPDLAFALPAPPVSLPRTGTVGVGLMAYRGRNGDRARAEEIHAGYLAAVTEFVRWLVEGGRSVRLFVGDRSDDAVVAAVLAEVYAARPSLDPSRVVAEPVADLHELMRQMAGVDTVVATRYHNVLCALRMSLPTISIGYATKHQELMRSMGLGEYCQYTRAIDATRLIAQFTELESRSEELRKSLSERNRANRQQLEDQFAVLSARFLHATARPRVSLKGAK